MIKQISKSEREYVVQGCQENFRSDGRSNLDFQCWTFEDNILPHVNGSSRFRIANNVDIIASIKLEVVEPKNHPSFSSNEGLFNINIEVSPSCSPDKDERKLQELGSLLSRDLQSIYEQSNAINRKALCIIPGKYSWLIHIDVVVIECGGDCLDYCSVAALVALKSTLVPRVELQVSETGVAVDFEVCGDFCDALPLDCKRLPICLTAHKVGSSVVLDATSEEQAASAVAVTVAYDSAGVCCGAIKRSGGTFAISDISQAMTATASAVGSIFQTIEQYTHSVSKSGNLGGSLIPDMPASRLGFLLQSTPL